MAEYGSTAVLNRPEGACWDYTVQQLHLRHVELLEAQLRERGREGWELVYMHCPMANEYLCVFKRAA